MPIELTPHNPDWLGAFEEARRELVESLPPDAFTAIEHVGSTAVPNLCAKPIVDMLMSVPDLSRLPEIEQIFETLGYLPWHSVAERASFQRRDQFDRATHQIHVVVHGSPPWLDQIAFRDWIRANEGDRKAYDLLKKNLAVKYDDTREYSEAKSDFVRRILAKCR